MPDARVFGFAINEDKLRNKARVFYREQDCLGQESVWDRFSMPFTDQPITELCEVLVYEEISLDLFDTVIIDNREIQRGQYGPQANINWIRTVHRGMGIDPVHPEHYY